METAPHKIEIESADAGQLVPQTDTPAKLCLKWRETWPGEKHQDFSAYDRRARSEVVGRIYELYHSPMKGKWFWGLTADGPGISRPASASGYERSAREAGTKVEAAWFKAIGDLPADAPDGCVGFARRATHG
jgi:hypothetical protein